MIELLTPLTAFGLQPAPLPLMTPEQCDAVDEAEAAIGDWLVNAPPVQQLDPAQLVPTQECIDLANLAQLDSAEELPPALVLAKDGRFYITDGHHRAIRALLRGCAVPAVVVHLE